MFIRRKEPSRLLSTIKTNFLSEIHSIRETQGNAERISVWVLLVKEAEAKTTLKYTKGCQKEDGLHRFYVVPNGIKW